MPRFLPPDPRKMLPSRAHPEHRSMRKELEKKHGYGYTEPLLLTMLGIGLMWNIEHQVRKHEERKDEEEEKERQREKQSKEQRARSRRHRRRDDDDDDDYSQSRAAAAPRDTSSRRAAAWGGEQHPQAWDGEGGRGRTRSRGGREVWYDHGEEDEEEGDDGSDYYYSQRPLEYRGYRDQYRDYRNDVRYEDRRDGSIRRSSRRDSW